MSAGTTTGRNVREKSIMMARLPWLLSIAIAVAAALAVWLLVRKNEDLRKAHEKLALRIDYYCHDLVSELESAAPVLSERSKPLRDPSLSPEDRKRAEYAFDQALPFGTGLSAIMRVETRHARAAGSLAITSRFLFCSGVRKRPENPGETAVERFGAANQRFREAQDREVIAAAVAAMAEAAREVESWPLLAP